LQARVNVRRSPEAHFDAAHTKRLQAGWFAWLLDYPSPTNVFGPLLSCGQSENVGRFCDPALEALGRRAGRTQTSDQPAAAELWAQLDRTTTDQAPWIPLSNFTRTTFVSERVGNFQYHPQWGVLLDQLWVR
jgi:ABC-type transport system substrate-binding protein